MDRFNNKLEALESLGEIFELVKESVSSALNKRRAGLMLGLSNLGGSQEKGFIGAYYPFGSNIIVMNRLPLEQISLVRPDLYKPYSFYILLHEYIHSLGYADERLTRETALSVAKETFGNDHPVTELARDFSKFLPFLVPKTDFVQGDNRIELIKDFDRSSTTYFA